MFNHRSNQKELLDDFELDDVELVKNLHEIEFTNRWFGSRHTLVNALDKIYRRYRKTLTNNEKIIFGDLGCGSGDLLRVTKEWSRTKNIKAKYLGFDANAAITKYAYQLTNQHPDINYHHVDVFDNKFKQYQFDVVTLNSFCHHLGEQDLIKLITQLKQQTKLAIVINDLHRNWFSYYGIKIIANLMHFSDYGKHDGPTSILRSFKKRDFISLMQSMNINHYDLRWTWAFRWQLIIWC